MQIICGFSTFTPILTEKVTSCEDSNGDYIPDMFQTLPEWSYETEGEYVRAVDISQDGEYIAIGSNDEHVYLFGKESNSVLWTYDAASHVVDVGLSADGSHLAFCTGSHFYLLEVSTEEFLISK